MAAGAPFVFLPRNMDPANLPQVAFVEGCALFLLWLTLGRIAPSALLARSRTPLRAPLVCFLAWAGLSVFWAQNRFEWLETWLHWAACGLVFLLVIALVRSVDDLRKIVAALFFSGLATALLGMAQYLWHVNWVPQAFPPAATFVNRNVAVAYVVLTLPFGLLVFATARSVWSAALSALSCALMVAYVFSAFSKAGWAALAVQAALGVALGLLVGARRLRGVPLARSKRLLAAGGALVAALLMNVSDAGFRLRLVDAYDTLTLTVLGARSDPRFAADRRPEFQVNSLRVRSSIWRNTLAMIEDHPVRGVGLGNHKVNYPLYARRAAIDELFGASAHLDHVHNEYLQIAAELGLAGAVLLVWLAVSFLRVVRMALANAGSPESAWLLVTAVVSIAGLLTDALVSFPLRQALPPFVLAIAAAVLVRLALSTVESASSSRNARLGFRLPVAAVLLAICWLQFEWIRSDAHCKRMIVAHGRQDWPRVVAEARAAHGLNPERPEPLFGLGIGLLASGDAPGAIQALTTLLADYPHDMNALGNLGMAYAAAGETSSALECYRQVVALKPDDPRVHALLGALFQKTGHFEQALLEYRLAAVYDPQDASYEMKRGTAALRLGQHAEAAEAFASAVARQPNCATAHKALGVVLFSLQGRREEGTRHLRQALALQGVVDEEQVRRLLEALERQKSTDLMPEHPQP